MINMYDAFSGETTIPVKWESLSTGYWDEDNYWVEGGHSEPVIISCTVTPFGDRESGTTGEALVAKSTGERNPEFMQFTGMTELQVNDLLTVYGKTFKVIRKLNYKGAGFFTCIGTTIKEDSR